MPNLIQLLQENQRLKNQLNKLKQTNNLTPYINDDIIKGGYRVVKTIVDRNNIDCCYRKKGMKVLVVGDDLSFKEYILKTDNCKENIWEEVDVKVEENEVFLIEDYSELSENLTTQKELNLILKQLVLNLQTQIDNIEFLDEKIQITEATNFAQIGQTQKDFNKNVSDYKTNSDLKNQEQDDRLTDIEDENTNQYGLINNLQTSLNNKLDKGTYTGNAQDLKDEIDSKTSNKYNDEANSIANDIIKFIDINTGEDVNYRETTTWKDGTSMTDAKVDGILYKKINNKYYRLEIADKINVKWFGAKGDGITDDTAAIQNAINNSLGRILFFPKGNYKHTGLLISDAINIEGESMNETLLTNTSASNFGIRVYNARGYMLPFTISNLQVRGTSTGAAILVDTEVKLHITHVYVIENEGIGVQIGTNGNHVSLLTISECTFQKNKGDAIYGVSNSTSQINAVNILDCSITGNYANGIKLTGTSINIENNTIQGNSKCGILISNFDQNSSNQGTTGKISKNYLELNKDGNIIIEVGLANGFARTCNGLEFSNNYSLMNSSAINSGVNTHLKITKTSNIASVDQYVKGFIFEGNRFSSVGTFIYADFGDALSVDSVLRFSEKEDTSEYVAEDLNTKYINFGLAKVFMAERLVVNGFFNQKGGDINYSNLLSYMSDSVDISTPKIAYYNLPIPSNKIIINASVYVDTDSTNYSVTFNVISRDPRLNGNAYTNLFNDASNVNKSGSQLIIGANLASYGSANNRRIKRLKEDLILKITVQGTNGTYFKIGNPILIIN